MINFTRAQVAAIVVAAFVNNRSVLDATQITPSTTIEEMEIDSLDQYQVLVEIESALAVTLTVDQKEKIAIEPTVGFITEVFYILS